MRRAGLAEKTSKISAGFAPEKSFEAKDFWISMGHAVDWRT